MLEARVLSGTVPEVSRSVLEDRVAPLALECWAGLLAGYEAAERVVELLSPGERVALVCGFVEAYTVPGAAVPSLKTGVQTSNNGPGRPGRDFRTWSPRT